MPAPTYQGSGPYSGKTADYITNYMRRHGWTQAGIDAVYQMRGLSAPPQIGALEGKAFSRDPRGGFIGSDGKIIKNLDRDAMAAFYNTFTQQAVDPFTPRTSISNLAGGILNGVGSYVGGPVWQAFQGVADYGNKALGNDDGTSYTDGQRSGADRAGAAIGAIAGATNAPGSYGANANAGRTGDDVGVFSNGGRGGMADVGAGNAGSLRNAGVLAGGAGVGRAATSGTGSGTGGSMADGTTTGSWTDWLDPLIDIGGALLAGDAAKDAGKTQAAAAAAALAEQRRQYDQNREDLRPYREAGGTAIGQLSAGTADGGDFNRDFTAADFVKDPGYQFRMDEGRNAVEGSRAASTGIQNGRTLAELARYGQNYASGEYSNAYNRFNNDRTTRFNRLGSIAGIGQTATNTGVAAGVNSVNNISDLTLEQANAKAAGRIGQANAYTSGAESLANFWRNRKYGGQDTNWIGG